MFNIDLLKEPPSKYDLNTELSDHFIGKYPYKKLTLFCSIIEFPIGFCIFVGFWPIVAILINYFFNLANELNPIFEAKMFFYFSIPCMFGFVLFCIQQYIKDISYLMQLKDNDKKWIDIKQWSQNDLTIKNYLSKIKNRNVTYGEYFAMRDWRYADLKKQQEDSSLKISNKFKKSENKF